MHLWRAPTDEIQVLPPGVSPGGRKVGGQCEASLPKVPDAWRRGWDRSPTSGMSILEGDAEHTECLRVA